MYAIIAAGGRQYRVSQGDVIYIDKVNQEADSTISFDVLMIGGDGDVKVGKGNDLRNLLRVGLKFSSYSGKLRIHFEK